jgi:biopolymer transport protein TolQ
LTLALGFSLSLIQAAQTQASTLSDLLLRASPTAKFVLAILAIFSIASWAIIFTKWRTLRNAERANAEFLSRFKSRAKLSDVYMDSETSNGSPVARVFLAGYDEITNQIGEGSRQIRSVDAISRVLQSATIAEISQLERSLAWLATTANASPFIGLFGTVVGIVIAFQGLSGASASSIQAVAPGIAEALIATAAGIAAAVPAAIFYNYFLNRVKLLTATIDRFTLELLNLVEHHYVRANL